MKKTTETISRLISDQIILETKSGSVKFSTDISGKLYIGGYKSPGYSDTLIIDVVNNCITASCLSVGTISASQYIGPISGSGGGGGSGSATPGLPNNSVQYNNAGDFAGSSNLTFNGTILSGTQASFVGITASLNGNASTVTNGVYTTNISSFATTGVTAGSGLTGGGTVGVLTVNVGAGDGISVAADSVAVDNTVIRTTGNQTIGGLKNFSSYITGSITGSDAKFTTISGSHTGSGAGLFGIPNSGLVNNSVTVGTTTISLGSSVTTIQGISVITGSTVTGSIALFTTVTGAIGVPLGNLASPSFSFIGDPNTGIYSPAADNISFVEGGTEAIRIDSNARVGINTSSPNFTLAVSGTLGVSGSTNLSTISGTTAQFTTITGSTIVSTTELPSFIAINTSSNGVHRLLISQSSAADNGIRITAPGATMNIYGSTGNIANIETTSAYQFGNLTSVAENGTVWAGRSVVLRSHDNASLGSIINFIGSTEVMRVRGGSNLDVVISGTNNSTGQGRLRFLNSGSAAFPLITQINDTNTGLYFPGADTVAFSTNGTERLRITGSGDIVTTSILSGTTAQFTTITASNITGTINFSASNPTHWSGSAPTTVGSAINRIAAAIYSGITGSIA
jgi:hypothetical protein